MKIFLSYASEDRKLVEPIYLALRAQGHKVFFDRTDLPPGEEYDSRIRQAIEGSDLLVFFLRARLRSQDAGRHLRFGWARRWSMSRIMASLTIVPETSGSSS
jgi:hypothetical protein